MKMQLLISDTNVIIDLDVCGLLEKMFQLPLSFAVPDILYLEELEDQHSDLPGFGLQVRALNAQSVADADALGAKYVKTSANDLFALVLAQQEECPLLTGDNALRKAATEEGVEIRGTIWIVEQLISEGIIDCDKANEAFDTMREKDRFLPWEKAEQMISRIRG